MKNRISVIVAIIVVLFLPVFLTYVYCTSSFLEDSAVNVFKMFGQSGWTKADKQELEKITKEVRECRKKIQEIAQENKELKERENRLNTKQLLLENWAKENGKLKTLNYVKRRFGGRIKLAAKRYGVKKELITAVITTEWSPRKNRSEKGAVGPMQLMPGTAKILKVDRKHEFKNILGGTKYLAKLIKLYKGNLQLALAAYNAGPGNVEEYNGIPPFKETKAYIERVGYLFTHQLKNA